MDSTLIYHYATQFELIFKIGNFGIIFDTRPFEINDLAVSSRHYPPLMDIIWPYKPNHTSMYLIYINQNEV